MVEHPGTVWLVPDNVGINEVDVAVHEDVQEDDPRSKDQAVQEMVVYVVENVSN